MHVSFSQRDMRESEEAARSLGPVKVSILADKPVSLRAQERLTSTQTSQSDEKVKDFKNQSGNN